MTARNPQVAASKSCGFAQLPSEGARSATIHPLHRQPPQRWIARSNGDDDALYRSVHPIEAARAQFQADVDREVFWTKIAIGVALFPVAYFCGQLIRWAVVS